MPFPIRRVVGFFFSIALCSGMAIADGPADNKADAVRPIPPPGIAIDDATKQSLASRCKAIRLSWQRIVDESKDTSVGSLASEILVFPRAVELAIELDQFYKPRETKDAAWLLDEADRRLQIARSGGSWADVVGIGDGSKQQLIVGGYTSKIDGSYQPYGVVVPRGFTEHDLRPRRLDVWFHGRGETQSEVAFLTKQRSDAGEYTPADSFVLHPYGRYCNAFKFAGEVDVLEVLDYIAAKLPVDPSRIAARGFSMGGAACWQFATHHADRFFAANPGAGFAETPEYLNFFQGEDVRKTTPDFQKTLWDWYNCPPWAANLKQCPTIAYSGELDKQKQAADVMEKALRSVGVDLVHVIGPDTAHKIHPASKIDIESRMKSLAEVATAAVPRRIDFTTVMLRYHKMHWVDVRGMQKHWKPARVTGDIDAASRIRLTTKNVTHLNLNFDAGQWPGATSGPLKIEIDGTALIGPSVRSDRSWSMGLVKSDGQWAAVDLAKKTPDDETKITSLRKRPGLQGPIDDALMDSFLFVMPGETSDDKSVQQWVDAESRHAMDQWRRHFRGDIRQTIDAELTDQQIASSNLLLFGDPQSNSVIAKIVDQLPIVWDDDKIAIGTNEVPRTGHVPILIFPNPLNPDRYVVINSGFTFRQHDYLSNARQTPKLPDWALVDITGGATTRMPGDVISAGFFDESWETK